MIYNRINNFCSIARLLIVKIPLFNINLSIIANTLVVITTIYVRENIEDYIVITFAIEDLTLLLKMFKNIINLKFGLN